MVLLLYRIAAECALWVARAGRPVWPERWRVTERLDVSAPAGSARDAGGHEGGGRNGRAANTIWLHAASLGECKGLRALVETFPDTLVRDRMVLLTCNTRAGLSELQAFAATRKTLRVRARLAPLDHPRLARRFIEAHDVGALVLYELELWPHWIDAARAAGVPVLWVSARFAARSRRRYAGGPLRRAALRRVLQGIAWTQTQTEADAAALTALGCGPCETGSDLKGLALRADDPATADDAPACGIAFVSFHADELPALLRAVAAVAARAPETPLWVFPRRADDPAACAAFASALSPHGFTLGAPDAGSRVVVDRFGAVESALRRAHAAVIGGSFADHGGHNLWEPLRAGTRMFIGPFHAAQEPLARPLAARGLLTIARNADELAAGLASIAARGCEADGDAAAAHRSACNAFLRDARANAENAARAAGRRLESVLRKHRTQQMP